MPIASRVFNFTSWTLFFCIAAERQLDIRKQAVKIAQDNAAEARKKLNTGLNTSLAVARADLDAARAASQLDLAERTEKKARNALGYFVGQPVIGALQLPVRRPDAITESRNLSKEKLLQLALTQRADMQALTETARAAERVNDWRWMSYLPTLSLVGGISTSTYSLYSWMAIGLKFSY